MESVLLISLFQSSDLLFNNTTTFIVPGARSFSFVWLRMIWRACWKRNGCFYKLSCIKHWWLDVVLVIGYNDLQTCFPAQHFLLHQFHTRQFVCFPESTDITAPATLWNVSDLGVHSSAAKQRETVAVC